MSGYLYTLFCGGPENTKPSKGREAKGYIVNMYCVKGTISWVLPEVPPPRWYMKWFIGHRESLRHSTQRLSKGVRYGCCRTQRISIGVPYRCCRVCTYTAKPRAVAVLLLRSSILGRGRVARVVISKEPHLITIIGDRVQRSKMDGVNHEWQAVSIRRLHTSSRRESKLVINRN